MEFNRLLALKIFIVFVLGFMLFIFILIRALDGRGEGFVKDKTGALNYIAGNDPNFLEFKSKFGGDIVDYYEMKRGKK
ncbi:hypothetical protein F-S17_0420 [Faustovirus]|nr:hypothetical protein F-LCD7_0423 [Faustovirus]QJX72191.1 hypothetical protein F-M6_0428 [Faustovirus]QJX72686.1 hypothetical protein F-S17_0420 [Faustovirus]QJX73182.1 hypothetical protein F-VV57_0421 [Faustovirus]QJX73689.1 hypothetical protein F-VV63_0423 [Faustovirus]